MTAYSSEIVASVGLLMDIGGILLLFRFGAIGGEWINVPGPQPSMTRYDSVLELFANLGTERNQHSARRGSRFGLVLATLGFILQIVAQWL